MKKKDFNSDFDHENMISVFQKKKQKKQAPSNDLRRRSGLGIIETMGLVPKEHIPQERALVIEMGSLHFFKKILVQEISGTRILKSL